MSTNRLKWLVAFITPVASPLSRNLWNPVSMNMTRLDAKWASEGPNMQWLSLQKWNSSVSICGCPSHAVPSKFCKSSYFVNARPSGPLDQAAVSVHPRSIIQYVVVVTFKMLQHCKCFTIANVVTW